MPMTSRASSEATESRGVSPAASNVTETPKQKKAPSKVGKAKATKPPTKGKKGGQLKGKNLPTVTGGTSTSYGNDQVEGPKELTIDAGNDIGGALGDANQENEVSNGRLSTVHEEPERNSDHASEVSDVDSTTGPADQLQGDNHVDTTIASQETGLRHGQKYTPPVERNEGGQVAKREVINRLNRTQGQPISTFDRLGHRVNRLRHGRAPRWVTEASFLKEMMMFVKNHLAVMGALLVALIVGFAIGRAAPTVSLESPEVTNTGIQWYGMTDVKSNLGQFIPTVLFHPQSYVTDREVYELKSSARNMEYAMAQLGQRQNLTAAAYQQIRLALPDMVVVRKDSDGVLHVPDRVFHAMKDRFDNDRNYQSTIKLFTDLHKNMQEGTLLNPSINRELQKYLDDPTLFTQLQANSNGTFNAWYGEQFQEHIDEYVKTHVVINREEALELVKSEFETNSRNVTHELARLSQELKTTAEKLTNLRNDPEMKKYFTQVAKGVFENMLQGAQLNAFSSKKISDQLHRSISNVNYFSLKAGAMIIPNITEESYVPLLRRQLSEWKVWLGKSLGMFISEPLPASEALTTWEEWGECFPLSLDAYDKGKGLGVKTAHSLIAEEVLVENILDSASISPGSGPKHMELLARYDNPLVHKALTDHSHHYVPGLEPLPRSLSANWVRLASWKFNAESAAYAQAFPVDLPLKFVARDMDVSATEYLIRVKDNWSEGKHAYTCIYRVRLHGERVGPEFLLV